MGQIQGGWSLNKEGKTNDHIKNNSILIINCIPTDRSSKWLKKRNSNFYALYF